MTLSNVSAPALLRLALYAIPTWENSLSTAADDAGQPSISGDLWSDNGMGLFGIYAHGITETWVMEKALIGLVACDDKAPPSSHTLANTSLLALYMYHGR